MSKKIELKVQIVCEKCKTTIMKAVSKLEGIKSISLDSEKSILTVIGTVDVVDLVKELRKAKKPSEILSVGPEKKEEPKNGKKDEKKDDKKDENKDEKKNNGGGEKKNENKKEENKQNQNPTAPCCGGCRQTGFPGFGGQVMFYEEPHNNCSIL